jgi:hypothetical protein
MATDLIRYDLLVQGAMRGVMRKVLADVAESGYLPGDHHFTISFRTHAPGVKISRRLQEQWPKELTIILQHQYSNLEVDEDGFSVTLSFRAIPENLYIPFAAVTGFFDPSVEFGLRFETGEPIEEAEIEERIEETRPAPGLIKNDRAPAQKPVKSETAKKEPAKAEKKVEAKPAEAREDSDVDAKIVSIDAFRKKT